MLYNQDVPGVVGDVGTVLAKSKINIARLELGREKIGGKAISLIHVDEQIPDDVLQRLRTLPNIIAAQMLEL
jgi:D-3-phosphoglycerate dehydrogenase